MIKDFESQYLRIMNDILHDGTDKPDRTGIGSRAIWHDVMRIDLAQGFPILTTRKISPRIAFEETWFFLRGELDTKKLEAKKINIWKGNTTREFLDNRDLYYLPEGHMGKGYSFQWRNFGGDYYRYDYQCKEEVERCGDDGTDQIKELFDGLKKDPYGRRHIVTAWNPSQISESALPPCHLYQQYQVLNGRLNSAFLARSQDFLYGTPYNIMGYALLNMAFAKALGLEPGILGYTGEDIHLYLNQIDIAKQQIQRKPYPLPTMTLNADVRTLDDILKLEYMDWELKDYEAHPDFKDKPKMAV